LFGGGLVVVRVTKCYPGGELFDEDQNGARAWKGHDWVAMDRLHTKGYISDPKSKAKSVVVTATGVQRSRELFEKHFGKKEP
jgi:uncharacterized protein YraI